MRKKTLRTVPLKSLQGSDLIKISHLPESRRRREGHSGERVADTRKIHNYPPPGVQGSMLVL